MKRIYIAIWVICMTHAANAQTKLINDSLIKSNIAQHISISGYGNSKVWYDGNKKQAFADMERSVLFIGAEFNKRIAFFSELEVEDAKVSGGTNGGEVAFEQAYINFTLNANNTLVAGLFVPRMGILNENHLPNTFLSNDRTYTETWVIPATWREIGVGWYADIAALPGISTMVAVTNGLNNGGFVQGSGIREGRYEGRNASANNIALWGNVQYAHKNITMQLSGYYGGSVALPPYLADSLQMKGGLLGTPVAIICMDIQEHIKRWYLRALATEVYINNAYTINKVYNNGTPSAMVGAYAEVGYNVWTLKQPQRQLVPFVRYERVNLNAQVPSNIAYNPSLNQQHLYVGLFYSPLWGLAIKADVHWASSFNNNMFQLRHTIITTGIAYAF